MFVSIPSSKSLPLEWQKREPLRHFFFYCIFFFFAVFGNEDIFLKNMLCLHTMGYLFIYFGGTAV
jgi:hypothetical protein